MSTASAGFAPPFSAHLSAVDDFCGNQVALLLTNAPSPARDDGCNIILRTHADAEKLTREREFDQPPDQHPLCHSDNIVLVMSALTLTLAKPSAVLTRIRYTTLCR